MLKMVDGTGIIGVDMVCPLGATVSPPQPPNYDNVEMEGVGSLMLPNSLKAPLERLELTGNSTQGENPAPEAPQEITSAGRKSRNLLIENISTFTVQNNIAYMPLPEGHETKQYTMLIQKKPGKSDNVGFTCGFYDKLNMEVVYSAPCLKDGNLVTANGIVNSKVGVNHFVCFAPADPKFFDIYNVIYVEGKETVLDYEPHGFIFDLKVTGKNLFDMSTIVNENGYADSNFGNTRDINHFYVTEGKRYLIIARGDTVDPKTSYSCIYFGENNLKYSEKASHVLDTPIGIRMISGNVRNTYIATANKTCTITKCMIHGTNNSNNAYTVEEIGVFELKNAETQEDVVYEPYTEQTVQIALDQPLRGIGEYKDVLTKDGVVRKIKRIVRDGSEDEKWVLSNDPKNVTTNRFRIGMDTINTYYKIFTMCDKLSWKNMNNVDLVGQTTHGKVFYVTMSKELAPNLEAFKTWLSQNPLIVDYVLAEPVTEPLPESVQAQLAALHSENGTTHVFVDSGEVEAGIKLTYRKEK